jgi:hypothetical protein
MSENKKITVEFAPGAFDNFDGTQEELDQLVAEITKIAETGELFERSRPVDLDEMIEEGDLDIVEHIVNSQVPRNLQ